MAVCNQTKALNEYESLRYNITLCTVEMHVGWELRLIGSSITVIGYNSESCNAHRNGISMEAALRTSSVAFASLLATCVCLWR